MERVMGIGGIFFKAADKTSLAVKAQFPDEKTINIGADMDAPFEVVVSVIDTVRFKLPQASYPDDKSFRAALKASGSKANPLFPAVVFVVAE